MLPLQPQIQGLKKQECGHISITRGKRSFGNRFACCSLDLWLWEGTICLRRLKVFSDEPGSSRKGQNWIETQSWKTTLFDGNNQFSLLKNRFHTPFLINIYI